MQTSNEIKACLMHHAHRSPAGLSRVGHPRAALQSVPDPRVHSAGTPRCPQRQPERPSTDQGTSHSSMSTSMKSSRNFIKGTAGVRHGAYPGGADSELQCVCRLGCGACPFKAHFSVPRLTSGQLGPPRHVNRETVQPLGENMFVQHA